MCIRDSPGGVRKLPPQGVDPLLRPVLEVVELLAELPFQLGRHALEPVSYTHLRMRMDENDENAAPSGGYAAVNLLIEGNESLAEEFGSVIRCV